MNSTIRRVALVVVLLVPISGHVADAAEVVIGGDMHVSKDYFVLKDRDGKELLRIDPGGCISVKPAICSRESSGTFMLTPGTNIGPVEGGRWLFSKPN